MTRASDRRRVAKRKAREDRLRLAKAARWAKPRTLVDVLGVDAVEAMRATMAATEDGEAVAGEVEQAEAVPEAPPADVTALAERMGAKLKPNPVLTAAIVEAFPDHDPAKLE